MAKQPSLPGLNQRYRAGRNERCAVADVAELVAGGRLPPGSSALQDSYKLLAREVDRAESESDRWGKAKVISEMRAVWVLLVGKVPDGGETEGLDDWVAGLPTGAVGDGAKR